MQLGSRVFQQHSADPGFYAEVWDWDFWGRAVYGGFRQLFFVREGGKVGRFGVMDLRSSV